MSSDPIHARWLARQQEAVHRDRLSRPGPFASGPYTTYAGALDILAIRGYAPPADLPAPTFSRAVIDKPTGRAEAKPKRRKRPKLNCPPAEVRAWAREQGLPLNPNGGTIPTDTLLAFVEAFPDKAS